MGVLCLCLGVRGGIIPGRGVVGMRLGSGFRAALWFGMGVFWRRTGGFGLWRCLCPGGVRFLRMRSIRCGIGFRLVPGP